MNALAVTLVTAALFLAAVLNLAADTRLRRRTTGAAAAFAAAAGAVLYGYGFSHTVPDPVLAVLRTLLALCRMFGGVNDLASVQAAPLFQSRGVILLFWFAHFLAFYVTASAAIASLGSRLLQRLRVTRLRRRPLLVVYGLNARSLEFGRQAARESRRAVLYADPDGDTPEQGAQAFGAVVDRSPGALAPDAAFLRRLGLRPGTRRVELAAMHADPDANLAYARAFLAAAEQAGLRPAQTALLAAGIAEEDAQALQATDGGGYGSVLAFEDDALAARLLFLRCPPCGMIRFREDGRAAEDFTIAVLGFGRVGRAVLRGALLNGQFAGSRFRADVFDPRAESGFLHGSALTEFYDLRFHAHSGASDEFYSYLAECGDSLRCVVFCTGSRTENEELAADVADWLRLRGMRPALLQATREDIVYPGPDGAPVRERLYSSGALDLQRLDAAAMRLNLRYAGGGDAEAAWRRCGYVSRMSCRAAADFAPAFAAACGKTPAEVRAGDWPPAPGVLERLAETEHLRWCAFHAALGYRPMGKETWARRAEAWRAAAAGGQTPGFRIGHDRERRRHACLVPWEALDELSARENAVTGGTTDYKAMDRDNVLALPELLAVEEA